jgi:hypothetical protein
MPCMPCSFRVIPADKAEPIHAGMVMMPDVPEEEEIRGVVEPMLGGFTTTLVKVLDEGKAREMFVDELATPKELPRNERATKLYRDFLSERFPDVARDDMPHIAGTAIVFDEQVWFD